MAGFAKGEMVYVRNEDGSVEVGGVLYQRMAAPDYDEPEAVCVLIGRRSAVYPAECVSMTRLPEARTIYGVDMRDELWGQVEEELQEMVDGGEAPTDLELEPVVEEMVRRAALILDVPVDRAEIRELVLAVHSDFCALQ